MTLDDCHSKFVQPVGPTHLADGRWDFVVWAPRHKSAKIHVFGSTQGAAPGRQTDSGDRYIEMAGDEFGYFRAVVDEVPPNCRYMYQLSPENRSTRNGSSKVEQPDPASRFQPDGVHRASQLVDLRDFSWTDHGWKPPTLEHSVFYELHIGTYTPSGTLDALTERLPRLADLGVTTVELMPVAQFPGARNWGYDGVYPYAVQNTYGGPRALQRFVTAAHGHGLAVALDVVYNHLGPEGNYLSDFGPYFTEKYKTPWGQAINFDDAESGPVRKFFIDNAIYWFENYHIDVLRLDAIHGIFDCSAVHFLAELQRSVEEADERLGRKLLLVAESDLNDNKVLLPRNRGGYGISAQWSDDFHHSLHTLLTNESNGYYRDFGNTKDLGVVVRERWLYRGQYSKVRKRRHGNSAQELARSRFVVCNQNHDQVGNRACGERLSQLVSFEAQKLAAGVTLLSPFVPMLFMGEEYGEISPFLYFTDHGDENLIEAVRSGRRAEFTQFGWQKEVPDPQDLETFKRSKLRDIEDKEPQRTLRRLYQKLLGFRRDHELGIGADWNIIEDDVRKTLKLMRSRNNAALVIIFNFGGEVVEQMPRDVSGSWTTALSSSDREWLGPAVTSSQEIDHGVAVKLSPQSFVVLQQHRRE